MFWIGVDPDLEKSGMALWDGKAFGYLCTMPFPHVVDEIIAWAKRGDATMVIEAGWLNKKSNFHSAQGAAMREKIAKNVGENHAVGKMIAQMCEHHGLPYILYKPTRSKAETTALFNSLGLWKGRTNQEERDAALIVFGR